MPQPKAQPRPDLTAYAQAPLLNSLSEWARTDAFVALPGDWTVFVADVEKSTEAIAAGRYKQVNTLGAACIVAAANATGCDDLPFSFGGDGAVVVVPPGLAPSVGLAWAGLQAQAATRLGLALRVGGVPVRELQARGAQVKVARRRLSAGFDVALFAGGGVALAEQLVKSDHERWQIVLSQAPEASMDGLECRWNDVPSRNGRIMTLLVRPLGADPAPMGEFMRLIEQAIPRANPVRRDNLPMSWPPRHLATEMALKHGAGPARWLRQAATWVLTGVFSGVVRRRADNAATAAGRYVSGVVANTDHVKLDDVFRAVLDVNAQDAADIEAMLEKLRAQGHLDFGIHYSDHALMTCFVRSLDRHLHFIDGGDGGYAAAAAQLKRD